MIAPLQTVPTAHNSLAGSLLRDHTETIAMNEQDNLHRIVRACIRDAEQQRKAIASLHIHAMDWEAAHESILAHYPCASWQAAAHPVSYAPSCEYKLAGFRLFLTAVEA